MKGRLVYLVGPSGAGKDSLIAFVRSRLGIADRVVFARRFITRAPEVEGEQHVPITPGHFMHIEQQNGFALAWKANGHCYGIGTEIRDWLSWGFNVVVNGSRAYLPQAAQRFPDLVTVHITAPRQIIQQRLLKRKRESPEAITERIRRSESWQLADSESTVTIVNDGELSDAGEQLIALLRIKTGNEPTATVSRHTTQHLAK